MKPRELVTKVINEIYSKTGITATAGIGTNLYLAKIAMDIVAKNMAADINGVRIAGLDEITYRKLLWNHRPLTDFWRIGKGYSKKLEKYRIFTMGDIARASIDNEDLLFKLFGINAELLIDHAWGYEPCTIESIKKYKPEKSSIGSGQVLHCAYNYEDAKLIVKEMTNELSLELVRKNLFTSQIVLTIEYDKENLINKQINNLYKGEITIDRYGRKIPKHAHGTINIDHKTASTKILVDSAINLYEKIVDKRLLIRKIYITANNVMNERNLTKDKKYDQLNIFTDYKKIKNIQEKEISEKNIQKAIINIKNKYGRNSIIKGMDLQKAGTTINRNNQIGGHKA